MGNKKYYLGLDIGTDSVGYAVTDENYKPIKFKGEPMLGVHLFDSAQTAAERRSFRTARRRLNRKQQRITILNEIFAKEIGKIDSRFFIRLKESGLHRDDASDINDEHIYFVGEDYSDKDYYKQYPTIHHLISELMYSDKSFDIRLVYIACAWLIGHRGHFLNEVDKDNIDGVLDFSFVYRDFTEYLAENDIADWSVSDENSFSEILRRKMNISVKEKELYTCFVDGKKPKNTRITAMVNLLCGGKKELKVLFDNEEYAELENKSVSLGMADDDFAAVISQIGDDGELLKKLKAIYDWSLLKGILSEHKCMSQAKVAIYEQHKKDLKALKYIIRTYVPEKYEDVFKRADGKVNNYVSYIYNVKSYNILENSVIPDKFRCKKEEFCDYLKSILKNIKVEEKDYAVFSDIITRVSDGSFMPKQRDVNNRVIPYQLYWYELNRILKNASEYLPFLTEKDKDGISNSEKILSVFTFRVPYFVGPLKNGWAVRKEGRIYPWNFENMVDLEASEDAFIKILTNNCTYIPGESVLPKNSLLYCKFSVLNEINSIKINSLEIPVEVKQGIYNEVFLNKKNKKVTLKKIKGYLEAINMLGEGDILSGIDETVKSSLKSLIEFDRLITSGILKKEQVERIIEKATYTENNLRLKKWLRTEFSFLPDEDINYISRLKYSDFGRLSSYLLEEIPVTDLQTGEVNTVIGWMWEYNFNFMQLMSQRFDLSAKIEKINREYYSSHPLTLSQRLDEMHISNSVKRPVIRALDIISDIEKVMGCAPKKVFVEMARGATAQQKNKRTDSRKTQLLNLYSKIRDADVKEMNRQLDELGEFADNVLQSDKVFLYFLQLGKCAYTGKTIENFNQLRDGTFNIEHIYPRAFIKDDSVLNNKVLVDSVVNGGKTDTYPITSDIRRNMTGFWKKLKDNGLMTEEKYRRLVRNTPFTSEERWNFINRQLVETRQSTKVLATLLKDRFGENTDIVYVKAGLVSELRHEVLRIEKTRAVNDLHHAKDAYLNIVAGNVYNTKFTKNWFINRKDDNYSIKAQTVFSNPLKEANWFGGESIDFVRRTVNKNAIHCTRYAYCKKGGLFDQMPVKARQGLVPRKDGLSTEKYGGYNKSSVSFFILVSFNDAKKKDVMFMPVELRISERFRNDEAFAGEYAKNKLEAILGKPVAEIGFPLKLRPIKINTVISLDGLLYNLRASNSGGKLLSCSLLTSNILSAEMEQYSKKLDSFNEKQKKNTSIKYDEKFDGISKEKNLELYDIFVHKLQNTFFSAIPANPIETLKNNRESFNELDMFRQVTALLSIISILKTGRSGSCDLKIINGVPNAANIRINALLRTLAKNYKDVRIVDVSASGLFENKTNNLLELL